MRRTRANYAGLVTMCDRWLGHLLETLRTQGRLDDTLVVVASDHGHTLWERRGYIGKRGYPSDPEVYDVPLLIRHPGGLGAGTTCDAWVQHHDVGRHAPGGGRRRRRPSRSPAARSGGRPSPAARRSATTSVVGLGLGDDGGDRALVVQLQGGRAGRLPLRPRSGPIRSRRTWSTREPALVRELFAAGAAEAAGGFPGYLLELAQSAVDAPGCSPIAVG